MRVPMTIEIPAGFEPHFRKSPFTDPWEPLYSKKTDKAVIMGLRLAKAHTNSRGLPHGGLIASLADNAMGYSCALVTGWKTTYVTVSLAVGGRCDGAVALPGRIHEKQGR